MDRELVEKKGGSCDPPAWDNPFGKTIWLAKELAGRPSPCLPSIRFKYSPKTNRRRLRASAV